MSLPFINIETDRLTLLPMDAERDTDFILRLLNEPSFLEYIGDKEVRNLEDARAYIVNGPLDSYERYGYGLLTVRLTATWQPVGICGLIKRETLDAPDIGFAFLPEFWRLGYGFEAAEAVLASAPLHYGLKRVVAITTPGNTPSISLLEKLGMNYEQSVRLTPDDPELSLFSIELNADA